MKWHVLHVVMELLKDQKYATMEILMEVMAVSSLARLLILAIDVLLTVVSVIIFVAMEFSILLKVKHVMMEMKKMVTVVPTIVYLIVPFKNPC